MSTERTRPFHAVMICGGAEKRRARALELAQRCVCSDPDHAPCGVCRDCRKVQSGIHPDVIPVEHFIESANVSGQIGVNPIRDLRADAFIKPNEAAAKVYVIDNAQNMNGSAQNAMLKLLEEGPSYAAFLFLCDRAGALLETIRSRCVQEQVGEDEQQREPGERAVSLVHTLAEGNELARAGAFSALECVKLDRTALQELLDDLVLLLREAAIGRVSGRFSHDCAQELAQDRPASDLLRMADCAAEAQRMTEFNVSGGHILGWLSVML